MEQIHQQLGDQQEPPHGTSPTEPAALNAEQAELQESWDERVIREGIEASINEDRLIDNRTARYIAGQLHGGQASALYALASSGAIPLEAEAELREERQVQPPIVQDWIDALTRYCHRREDKRPISDWVERAEAQDRAELLERINAAGTPLASIATVQLAESPLDEDGNDGNHFHWGDAARWSPDDGPRDESASSPALSDEQLDALFSRQADEEVGDVHHLGWYGLVRWTDQPGGLILKLDENGIRHTRAVATDDALTARWANICNEYGEFYEQRAAYETVTDEADIASNGLAPRVWVGSLADYANGDLHGTWFHATHEPAELELAAKFMLRLGHAPDAEEWAVMDYDGFVGIELSEYESFDTISRIARGIAEHGEGFAHWAAYVGSESTNEIDHFADHCRGEWDSFEAYVKDYLEVTEFYRFLEHVPEDMRGYVEVDVEQIARDWECDYYVAEGSNGRVWVFDPRE